jgi:Novel STAND NTPase 1
VWLESRLGPGERCLLVVDQVEELFTVSRDPFEREAFVDNLLTASNAEASTHVLIALRADFYAHCGQYPDLRRSLAEHQEYVGPMTPDELRRAIESPAANGRWTLDPGLVDLVLRDAGDEPGALPLVSHALLETWARRRGRTLTVQGYAETGGVHGAIAQTAGDRLPATPVDCAKGHRPAHLSAPERAGRRHAGHTAKRTAR